MIDLKPFQGCFIDGFAWTIAVGKVVDDWTLVGYGPWRPLKFDFSARSDRSFDLGWCCGYVADDVGRSVGSGSDESVVEVLRDQPANGYWSWRDILIAWIIAVVTSYC